MSNQNYRIGMSVSRINMYIGGYCKVFQFFELSGKRTESLLESSFLHLLSRKGGGSSGDVRSGECFSSFSDDQLCVFVNTTDKKSFLSSSTSTIQRVARAESLRFGQFCQSK